MTLLCKVDVVIFNFWMVVFYVVYSGCARLRGILSEMFIYVVYSACARLRGILLIDVYLFCVQWMCPTTRHPSHRCLFMLCTVDVPDYAASSHRVYLFCVQWMCPTTRHPSRRYLFILCTVDVPDYAVSFS